MERFVCNIGRENVQLSPEQLIKLGIETPEQLHMDPAMLSAAAIAAEKTGWVRIPFCNTLCGEGLGAHPELTLQGAKIRENLYQTPEALPEAFLPDFPRMEAMLKALDQLQNEGKQVIYQIEGPFTLLSYLIPMGKMFSALRKPIGLQMLLKAENWISQYAGIIAEHGVKVMSFADPIASMDILGKKVFSEIYRGCCERVLLRIRKEHPTLMIHLCGRLTQSLLDIGACHAERWTPEMPCANYSEALTAWCAWEKENAMAGQYCLNLLETKHPFVTRIFFNNQEE